MMPHLPDPDDGVRATLHGVRALLLDLDGVLLLKGRPLPGAVEALAELDRRGVPYLVLSNTSLWSRATLARYGERFGFAIPADRYLTALTACVDVVRDEIGPGRAYVIASADALREFDGVPVLDAAAADADPAAVAAVVLGDSPDQLTKENLDRAFRLVLGGAQLLGMHRNPWWLTPEGPTLDAGTFLVGLEWATRQRARTLGKPDPAFFRAAVRRLATEAAARGERPLRRGEILMVGDDVRNDIGGARRVGLRTAFVRTGKHGDMELAEVADRVRGAYRPDVDAPSLIHVVASLPEA